MPIEVKFYEICSGNKNCDGLLPKQILNNIILNFLCYLKYLLNYC